MTAGATGGGGGQDTHGVQLKAPIRSRPPLLAVLVPGQQQADKST